MSTNMSVAAVKVSELATLSVEGSQHVIAHHSYLCFRRCVCIYIYIYIYLHFSKQVHTFALGTMITLGAMEGVEQLSSNDQFSSSVSRIKPAPATEIKYLWSNLEFCTSFIPNDIYLKNNSICFERWVQGQNAELIFVCLSLLDISNTLTLKDYSSTIRRHSYLFISHAFISD